MKTKLIFLLLLIVGGRAIAQVFPAPPYTPDPVRVRELKWLIADSGMKSVGPALFPTVLSGDSSNNAATTAWVRRLSNAFIFSPTWQQTLNITGGATLTNPNTVTNNGYDFNWLYNRNFRLNQTNDPTSIAVFGIDNDIAMGDTGTYLKFTSVAGKFHRNKIALMPDSVVLNVSDTGGTNSLRLTHDSLIVRVDPSNGDSTHNIATTGFVKRVAALNTNYWSPHASNAIANNNTGNVGIGTTTPTSKLHVVGDMRVDNDAGDAELGIIQGVGYTFGDNSNDYGMGKIDIQRGAGYSTTSIFAPNFTGFTNPIDDSAALIFYTDSVGAAPAGVIGYDANHHAHLYAVPGGGGVSQPANQIVYGTGSGVTSSADFIVDTTNGAGGILIGVNNPTPIETIDITGTIATTNFYNFATSNKNSISGGGGNRSVYLGDYYNHGNGNVLTINNDTKDAYLNNPSHDSKFGINNPTPTVALDVVGDITLGNATTDVGISTVAAAGVTYVGDINGNFAGTVIELHDTAQYMAITASKGIIINDEISIGTSSLPTQMLDVNGNAQVSGYHITPPDYEQPTTGSTITTVRGMTIIDPAGAILALTIALPSSPVDGQRIQYSFSQAVTTLTFTGGTLVNPITTTGAGGTLGLIYGSTAGEWFKTN